jgi:predicted small lipoprotein YifL
MRICWAQYTLWAVIAVLGVASMLAGCGSKGDLYLPAPDKAQATPQQQEQ